MFSLAFLTSFQFWASLILIVIFQPIIRLYSTWKRMPPGPVPWPIIGNFLVFDPNKGPHDVLLDLSRKYGDVMSIFYAHCPSVVLSKFELAKSLFQQAAFSDRPESPVGACSEGHHQISLSKYDAKLVLHRKVMAKCMKASCESDRLEKIVTEMVDLTVECMLRNPSKIDAMLYMCHVNYNIFTRLGFGTHYPTIDDPEFLFVKKVNDANFREATEASNFDFLPFADWLPLIRFPSIQTCVRRMEELGGLREKRILEHRGSSIQGRIRDFCDALLEEQSQLQKDNPEVAADKLSDQYVTWIMMHFMSDSADPTSRAMWWIVLYMIMYPQLQEECFQEIKEAIGDRPPQLEDRPKTPMLDAFILETMRMRPVNQLALPHAPNGETKIGEYLIPKGTMIIPNVYAMHHDTDYWTDPTVFDPRRHFLDEQGQARMSPPSFAPYGFGRRVCPAEQLVRKHLYLTFARLLQRVRFEPIDSKKYTDDYDKAEILNLIPLPFEFRVSPRGVRN